MSSLRKIDRDFAKADLAAVGALLDQMTDDDMMARIGLESRRDELLATINSFNQEMIASAASAALFFGGRPVIGNRGIETEFGTDAVAKFQDLVAKVLAQHSGGLGQRGTVPNKSSATLHITDIVRGSFGFLLEEVESQGQIVDTALKTAVDDTSHLLEAFSETDEEVFRSAVESADSRVLTTAREFFEIMRSNGATMRLVVGDADKSFGDDAVARAADRATSTTVEETAEPVAGRLAGVLPEARQFEFNTAAGTIRGRIDKSLSGDVVASFNRDLGIEATARVLVKRVKRSGAIVRESYVLLALEPRQASSDPIS